MINTKTMVSMTEANQNFSRVAKIVDERGSAVILKNNIPRYLILDFQQIESCNSVNDDDLMMVSSAIIAQNREAYEVLAK